MVYPLVILWYAYAEGDRGEVLVESLSPKLVFSLSSAIHPVRIS